MAWRDYHREMISTQKKSRTGKPTPGRATGYQTEIKGEHIGEAALLNLANQIATTGTFDG